MLNQPDIRCMKENIVRIKESFPNKELLNQKEVSEYCGIDPRTVKTIFPFKDGFISVVKLAKELS